MLRKLIIISSLFTAVLPGQVVKTGTEPELPYDAVVRAGQAFELSVEQKPGIKYEWSDGGAGRLELISGTSKARWTAPETPGKENPAVIKILARPGESSGTFTETITKKIAVLGGRINAQPLLFFCAGPGPARLFRSAANQVKGTRYQWEIVRGTEYLSLLPEDINRSEAKFKTRKPSGKKDDVEIKLTYTLGTGRDRTVYESSNKTYIMMPVALKKLARENSVEEGPDLYGYATTTKYQLLDQFNEPVQAEGIVIEQDITLVANPLGVSEKAIKLDFNQYVTDYEGIIGSRRYISSVFPLPVNFSVVYEQDLYVNGSCLLEKLDITYGKNGVDEVKNRDRLTRRERLEKSKNKNEPGKDSDKK